MLRAENLSTGYNGHPIVRDLDLTLEPGTVTALLGPNGAGKTTTLLTLAGMVKPLGGTITYNGNPFTGPLSQRARNGLAYVSEERSVFMSLTTAENLRVGRCDVDRVLEIFPELERLMNRKAGLLSGGEQQMLTLARALARNAQVLLADELSLGLAPLIVERLLQAVKAAAKEQGVAVLLVEQHIRKAIRVADQVMVMRRGDIVLTGTGRELSGRLADVESAYLADERAAEAVAA